MTVGTQERPDFVEELPPQLGELSPGGCRRYHRGRDMLDVHNRHYRWHVTTLSTGLPRGQPRSDHAFEARPWVIDETDDPTTLCLVTQKFAPWADNEIIPVISATEGIAAVVAAGLYKAS